MALKNTNVVSAKRKLRFWAEPPNGIAVKAILLVKYFTLERYYIVGARTFLALAYFKLNLLAVVK